MCSRAARMSTWVLGLVAVVAVGAGAVVAIDAVRVSEEELRSAVERAVYPFDGRLGAAHSLENISLKSVEVAVAAELGREVTVRHGRSAITSDAERTYFYGVSPSGREGPDVCVTVREFAIGGTLREAGLSQADISVEAGTCPSA